MEFLKQKVMNAVNLSKKISKSNKITVANGKDLLLCLINNKSQITTSIDYQHLIKLSMQFHEYTDMFNLLITELGFFSYKPKSIRRTIKILNIIWYLLLGGNSQFANDFKKNQDLLTKLSTINTHSFQNSFLKQAKQMTYSLELIRHRVLFVLKLINNPNELQEQRSKFKAKRVCNQSQKMEAGQQTMNSLKIDIPIEKSLKKGISRKRVKTDPSIQKQNKAKDQLKPNNKTKQYSFNQGMGVGHKISNDMVE